MLSHSLMSDSLWPHGLYSPPGFSVHGDSPGKNIGVCCHALLQEIFPTQGLNPGLLHWRQILYHLSHQGSPRILEWVAYSFSRGSSWPRNRTRVSCIVGGFFYQLIYKTQSLRTGKMSGSFICCNRFSFCFPHTYVYLPKRSIDSNNFWISNPVSMSLGFTTSRSWWILDI